jgi:hypothetical protein
MDLSLQETIIKPLVLLNKWTRSFVDKHNGHDIDVSMAMRSNPTTPTGAPNQPKQFLQDTMNCVLIQGFLALMCSQLWMQ